VEKFDRKPRSWCGTKPRGWTKESSEEAADCEGSEADEEGCGAGARGPSGCCRMDTRSSTSRADAIGAIPGRVTVHCWSSVASLSD
jgi:hypothetical protein